MSKLRTAEIEARVYFAADYNSAAYTRTECDYDNVFISLCRSAENLSVCGNVSIVFNIYVSAQTVL